MEVHILGRNPVSEVGRVFHASLREWAMLHEATRMVCERLLAPDLHEATRSRAGAGPREGLTCQQMAARLERWMQGPHFAGTNKVLVWVGVALACRKPAWPRSAAPEDLLRGRDVRPLVAAWVRFLNHCGGYAVW